MGALLMGPEGGFITGGDILMDAGVIAAYWWYGELGAGPEVDGSGDGGLKWHKELVSTSHRTGSDRITASVAASGPLSGR